MFRYFSTVSFWTLVSRFLGYGRDVGLAIFFGVGAFLDAFLVAFALPGLLRAFVAEGAVNSGFISIYVGKLEKDKKQAAFFSGEAILLMTGVTLVLVLLAEIFMPYIIFAIAGGFRNDPTKFDLTVSLARIMFPYIAMITQVALFSGILQGNKLFGVPAFAAIFLNLAFWAAFMVLFFYPALDHSLLFGGAALVGGVAQWVVVFLMCWKKKLLPVFTGIILSVDTKKMLGLMLPMMLLAGALQLNFLVNRSLISYLQEGSVIFVFYAERLIQLPVGVFGATVGVVLLPLLSRHLVSGEKEAFCKVQNQGFIFILLTGIPACFGLLALSETIIFSMFGYGAFEVNDVEKTAFTLALMATGLPAFLLGRFFLAIFFALQDVRVPLRIGIVQAVLNIIFTVLTIPFLQHASVALAVSLSAWIGCVALGFVLHRRGHLQISRESWIQGGKIVLISLVMMLVVIFLNQYVDIFKVSSAFLRVTIMALLVLSGISVYGFLLYLWKIVTPDSLRGYFRV